MEKKIYLFCAALAALATFNSCTSDDEIVENTIPEQPVEVKGEPISFTASVNDDGATRATAATNLTGFTLWGVQGTSAVAPTLSAYKYKAGSGTTEGSWVYDGTQQPTYDTGGNFYFYALAVGDDTDAKAITFEDGASTGINGAISTIATGTIKLLDDPDSAYNKKKFTYSMPVVKGDTIDLDKQEDLLVAHNFGDNDGGWSTGTVPLNFVHAFSNFEIKVALPLREYNTGSGQYTAHSLTSPGSMYYIKSITIHGLKRTGTYKFGQGWTDANTNGDIIFTFSPYKLIIGKWYDEAYTGEENPENYQHEGGDNPTEEQIAANAAKDKARRVIERRIFETVASSRVDGAPYESVMVIPQTFTPWATGSAISPNKCYIMVEGFVINMSEVIKDYEIPFSAEEIAEATSYFETCGEITNDTGMPEDYDADFGTLGFGDSEDEKPILSTYLPFRTTTAATCTLAPGKRYTFYIDLSQVWLASGTAQAITPM